VPRRDFRVGLVVAAVLVMVVSVAWVLTSGDGGHRAGSSSGGSIDVIVGGTPTPGGGGGALTCDLNATTGNFASQVSAATTGQTVCLTQSASYGSFTGTNKAITIAAADGTTPSMTFDLANGDTSFTIDGRRNTFTDATGLTIGGGSLTGTPGPQNVTIKNAWFGGEVTVDGPTGPGILFDHNVHKDFDGDTTTAAFHFAYGGPSGATIQNSQFKDMSSDGIQTGAAVTIKNDEFFNVSPTSGPGCSGDCHTDAVQFLSGDNSVVTGNWVHGDCEQGIGGFDGVTGVTAKNNVVVGCSAHSLVFGGSFTGSDAANVVDFNSVIRTGAGDADINCSAKTINAFGVTMLPTRINIRNNYAQLGLELTGDVNCTPLTNSNNMFASGATGSNFNGSPTFVGGGSPGSFTQFSQYCLAAGSAGITGASDGTQVGACGGGFTGGPPTS
jgi:hypothetical protein